MTNLEINWLIEEHIFGRKRHLVVKAWDRSQPMDTGPGAIISLEDIYSEPEEDWSTDIAAAWQVVEKMGGRFLLDRPTGERRTVPANQKYVAVFSKPKRASGHGETAPMAICLAALKAVGVSVPEDK